MSESTLDCRNLACPQPVIRTKNLLAEATPALLTVIVDNEPALENVSRFLASQHYAAASEKQGDVWRISAVPGPGRAAHVEQMQAAKAAKGTAAQAVPLPAAAGAGEPVTLVLIASPCFGSGDDVLGGKLMKNFLATLPELGESLWRVILLNGGVQLAVEGSPVIDALRALEASGVSILVCGTCLEHFDLLKKKAVGQTTNMLDVVTGMQFADKILRI